MSIDGIHPDDRKIKAAKYFPTHTRVHGVRQFVRLASYFRKFVEDLANIVRPLVGLTKNLRASCLSLRPYYLGDHCYGGMTVQHY